MRGGVFGSPLLLGFDGLERLLERAARASGDGYPPFNIEQPAENRLRITLAVAGFASEELSITLEDRQLLIRGKRSAEPERVFLHRGIAMRQFQKSFVLAEGLEISGAELEQGLLHIDLVKPQPDISVHMIVITEREQRQEAPIPHRRRSPQPE